MNLKRFTGRTTRDAMQKVKAAFGHEAIVLSTKPCPEGVEIIAMAADAMTGLEKQVPPAPPPAAPEPLPGYKPIQQMVFCDFYPSGKTQYEDLRDAMDRLVLNDSSFTFEPESNDALGFGFRCGFLGLLHMEIIQERLEREFNIEVIQTAPTVTYEILLSDDTVKRIDSPSQLPNPTLVKEIREPFIRASILCPKGRRCE